MLVCPLDFRYGRKELKQIFSRKEKLRRYLQVEAALAEAQANLGMIPPDAAKEIALAVEDSLVSVSRVEQIESEIRHDVMAVVIALTEVTGESGKFIHLGATSYDIVDTATALQLQQAIRHIGMGLVQLRAELVLQAEKHRDTVMIGRTHGQHATPITFGLKMAVYADEVHRHVQRLKESASRICVGKMSGATGSMAAMGGEALKVQAEVMEILGLEAERASTQIVQRDRMIEFVSICANIATTVEKVATEVRNLQRTEIGEVGEAFDVGRQVGSSTMAQKKNPIVCENITGLARLVRGYLGPMWEGAVQWHERDLSNSSAERFIIPHIAILTDDIIAKLTDVISNLAVDEERMRANLELSGGRVMAERFIMALVERGVGRQDAHEMIRQASMQEGVFRDALTGDDNIVRSLSVEEIDALLDPTTYTGSAGEIVDAVIAGIREG